MGKTIYAPKKNNTDGPWDKTTMITSYDSGVTINIPLATSANIVMGSQNPNNGLILKIMMLSAKIGHTVKPLLLLYF